MDFLKKHAYAIVAGILLFHFILSLAVSRQESAILDEQAHIPAAYTYVDRGDMRLNPEHPPLLKDLAGVPLQFLSVSFPYDSDLWTTGVNEQWKLGNRFLNENDTDAILLWSRVPIAIIAVLLGIALFVWTKELGGTLAGLFAVTLYAFDPNIIAHNHYVTTDLGIAAFIFFAFYFFVRFLQQPTLKNVIVAGIFLGLAELTKFSAVLLFPVFGLFVILYALTKPRMQNDTRGALAFRFQTIFAYGLKYAASIIVCFALIWSLYAFNTLNMPGEKLVILADLQLSQKNIAAAFAHTLVVSTSGTEFLKPLSEYFLGVAMVFSRVAGGNVYYFLGAVTNQASPWYFPVVFLLKETLVFLFLLLAAALYAFYRIGRSFSEKTGSLWDFFARSFQNKISQYLSVFFILFYAYISITGNLNIGFRHLFPILPFLYMLVAKTVFDFFKRHSDEPITRTVLATVLGGLTLAILAVPILTYPRYLSYFNAVAGGNQNGYLYVTDSNYDWGQDLKNLSVFIEAHNRCKTETASLHDIRKCALTKKYPSIDTIRVDYFGDFGGASPAHYLGDKLIPWWDKRAPEAGWYAISAGFLQESLHKTVAPGEQTYDWLSSYAPVARAGDSIFIYYISPEIMDK